MHGKFPKFDYRQQLTRLGEYLKLIWINLQVQKRNFIEFLKVSTRYYVNWTFCKIDFSLLLTYFFHNPFTISKEFLKAKGEKDVYAYGETPLTSLETIVKECKLRPYDTVYELGSGRGRTCFWLNCFVGCRVVGIEYIPDFVNHANLIKKRFNIDGVEFRCEDFLKTDYTKATVVYLYGTCLEDIEILALIEKFKTLQRGAKIITVSYPLTDYTSDRSFEVMNCFQVPFTWGTTEVYLHIKK